YILLSLFSHSSLFHFHFSLPVTLKHPYLCRVRPSHTHTHTHTPTTTHTPTHTHSSVTDVVVTAVPVSRPVDVWQLRLAQCQDLMGVPVGGEEWGGSGVVAGGVS